MHKDALKTIERKFGQSQAVVNSYLDKLSNFPPLKMSYSESMVSYSATTSVLVRVLRSVHYHQDFSSASILGPSDTEAATKFERSLVFVYGEKQLELSDIIEFNNWLKEKAEAHERITSSVYLVKNFSREFQYCCSFCIFLFLFISSNTLLACVKVSVSPHRFNFSKTSSLFQV